MATLLRRRSNSSTIESDILTGMVVSTDYLRNISQALKLEYFENNYVKIVVKWILTYYKKYQECPAGHIKDIYNSKKDSLKESDADLIATFLDILSRRYENTERFNVEYLLDRTFAYFKKRGYKIMCDNILSFIEVDQLDKADQELTGFHQVARDTGGWVDPFDPEYISNYFDDPDIGDHEKPNYLFKLIGQLGEHIGTFRRGWLVGILAPMKRGKTNYMMELALQALGNRLNVIFISLEMSEMDIANRFYKMIIGKGNKKVTYFPVFDCQANQNGFCTKPERTNTYTLYKDNKLPDYDPTLPYKVCTECRGKNRDYKPALWYENIQKTKLTFLDVKKGIQGFSTCYGNSLKIKSYPAFSANIQDIKRDLELLEITDGFVPDVIVVDYADILGPEDSRVEGRDRYDETWKMLKNMAAVKHCLVLTASQSNRKTLDKKDVKASDIAEDIRKIAHVDAMFALSQTPEEKTAGIMRINVVAHRWQEFDETRSCLVLQQLSTGQVALDSQIVDN